MARHKHSETNKHKEHVWDSAWFRIRVAQGANIQRAVNNVVKRCERHEQHSIDTIE